MHICIICTPAKTELRTSSYLFVFIYFYKNPHRSAYADPHTLPFMEHGMKKIV